MGQIERATSEPQSDRRFRDVITPSGEELPLTYSFRDQSRIVSCFYQPEFEAKGVLELPHPWEVTDENGLTPVESRVERLLTTFHSDLDLPFQPLFEYEHPLMSSAIPSYHYDGNDILLVSPLANRGMDVWSVLHGGGRYHQTKKIDHHPDEQLGIFEREIIARKFLARSRDSSIEVQPEFIVGRRQEVADYYDTSDGLLKQLGVTARLKNWYATSQAADSPPVASMITVKVDGTSNTDSSLKLRHEYSVPIYHSCTEEELKTILHAILAHCEVNVDASALQKFRTVNNDRYGLMITHHRDIRSQSVAGQLGRKNGAETVGFITVDHYHCIDDDSSEHLQVEVEFYPEAIGTISEITQRTFFRRIREALRVDFDSSTPPKCHS